MKFVAFKRKGPGKPWYEEDSSPFSPREIKVSRSVCIAFICVAYSNLADIELQTIPMVSGFNSFLDFYSVKGRKQKTPCWISALSSFSWALFVPYLKKMWSHTTEPVQTSTHRIPAPSIPWQKLYILTAVCEVPHCCYKWPVLALSLLMHFFTVLKDSWLRVFQHMTLIPVNQTLQYKAHHLSKRRGAEFRSGVMAI